jgi:hypothetical protein
VSVSFVTPLGALAVLVIGGLFPIGVLLSGRRRLETLCARLGLRPPPRREVLPSAIALTVVIALLALAAAQPVAARRTTTQGRADAEAFFVFDVSRSMGARSPGSPSRFDQARRDAKELRAELPGLPVGIASLTDRLLPHLFPSVSSNAFNATLDDALGVDRPTSSFPYGNVLSTKLGTLGDLIIGRYFPASARKRVVVVFTDGESRTEDFSTLADRIHEGKLKVFFFRYWRPADRVYDAEGRLNTAYAPDRSAEASFTALGRGLSIRVFEPGRTEAAAAAIRAAIGKGPTTTRGRELGSVLLTPYVVLAAFLPLLFLLLRLHGVRLERWGAWRARRDTQPET